MSNSDTILEFLENNRPGRFCDDCIATKAGVKPRQQVNQICNRLSTRGTLVRGEGSCTTCGGSKVTNAIASSPSKASRTQGLPQRPTVPENVDIERIRTQIVRICQEVSKQAKVDTPLPKGIAGIINLLKDEQLIPRHQANMMLTLCGLRNVYVWDRIHLGPKELAVASAAWGIVEEWWGKNRGKEVDPPTIAVQRSASSWQAYSHRFWRGAVDFAGCLDRGRYRVRIKLGGEKLRKPSVESKLVKVQPGQSRSGQAGRTLHYPSANRWNEA